MLTNNNFVNDFLPGWLVERTTKMAFGINMNWLSNWQINNFNIVGKLETLMEKEEIVGTTIIS